MIPVLVGIAGLPESTAGRGLVAGAWLGPTYPLAMRPTADVAPGPRPVADVEPSAKPVADVERSHPVADIEKGGTE